MRSQINCTVCDFKTTLNYVLKRHTDVHHKEAKTITCAVCEEKFQTKGELNKHMKDLHTEPMLSQTQTGKKQSSRIACELCRQRFNKRTTFNTHIEKKHRGVFNNNLNLIQVPNGDVPPQAPGDKRKECASASTSEQDQ